MTNGTVKNGLMTAKVLDLSNRKTDRMCLCIIAQSMRPVLNLSAKVRT